jgi:hypothetical protein
LVNVKLSLESKAADTLVPATVTITPEVLKARRPVLEALDVPEAPETVPTWLRQRRQAMLLGS